MKFLMFTKVAALAIFFSAVVNAAEQPNHQRIDSSLVNSTSNVTYLCIHCKTSNDFSQQAQEIANRRKSGQFALVDKENDFAMTFEVEFVTTTRKNRSTSQYLVKPIGKTQKAVSFLTASNNR